MAVIGTLCEVMAPSKPPTTVPPMIHSQALESIPLVLKLINTPNTASQRDGRDLIGGACRAHLG